MHFPHSFIYLFTSVTSMNFIDIYAIYIFIYIYIIYIYLYIYQTQTCMNHKDKKIITLFVNNVAQLTAYLANA